jgi:hypothetical protein
MIALAWVATVALASTLTWTVISSAGARAGGAIALPIVSANEQGSPASDQATRSWTGHAGRVTARCAGGSVALGTAVPEVGYWVKVYDPGPDILRVDFESTDPDDYGEVRLTATCEAGSPVFRKV